MATAPASESKRSYCRICSVHCGIIIDYSGDEIIKVRGDKEHPFSKGYTCPKGRAIGQIHHHADAITQPMMRKHGELVPVSWDECLDDLAARLRTVIDTHGPQSVGFFFGSGIGLDGSAYRLAEAFHSGLGYPPKFSPVTIDGTAKIMVASLVGGSPALNAKADYPNVDMLLYVGSNPMVSHGHNTSMCNPALILRAAAERGELWTIDPLRTETAKFSTRHIAPIPGTDHAILAWLVHEILKDGPITPAQPITGLDELRHALRGYDRAYAAAIAGIAEQDLEDLLAAIRRKGKVAVETGTGVTMSRTANVTHWLSWVLMILTGAMNRPGGAWFNPGFHDKYEETGLAVYDNPFTPGPPTMPGVDGIIGDWPCACLPGEIEAGNIKALMNLGGGIIRSFPDVNALAPALKKLDVFMTLEVLSTETTALSTHVLSTKDQVERPELTFWDSMSPRVSAQYAPAIVPPTGERRSSWWIIAQVMKRLGMDIPIDLPEDDRAEGADEAVLRQRMTASRCGFDEVKEKGFSLFPLTLPAPWVDEFIEKFGGWRLAPPAILDFWEGVRADDEAALGQPRPLCFISRRQRRKLNASLDFLGSPADIILNPETAAAHGIVHGGRVRVHTDRGELFLTANVDDAIRPGVASIPHGHRAANVNYLTNAKDVDPMGGQVIYTAIPIGIEPAEAEAAA